MLLGQSETKRSLSKIRNHAMRLRSPLAAAIAGMLMLSTFSLGVGAAQAATPTTVTFNYTGAAQTWTVPPSVFYATFDVSGAQGADSQACGGLGCLTFSTGGLGGEATEGRFLSPGTVVTIYVAGQGQSPDGGFGGGGRAAASTDSIVAGGGGGASDVRIGGSDLAHRVLVAGGGGGAGDDTGLAGGSGGGSVGGAGSGSGGGSGGNQDGTSGSGQLGTGSPGDYSDGEGGGGGGGYWGGAGGGFDFATFFLNGGGGGGSGFGPSDVVFHPGVRAGDGLVTITYTPSVADLSISIGASPNPVVSGRNLTYTITVHNYGPNTAYASVVIAVPPSASQFQNIKNSQGSCTTPAVGHSGTIVCKTNTIKPGANAVLTEVVKIVAAHASTVSETASVSSDTNDPQPANNSATVTTAVV